MEDPEGDMSDLSTKPIAVEDIIGIVEYKFLPDRLRQMILAELVYCTNPLTRVYPGCVNTVDRSLGRREAFWLALCRSVIINEAHLVQSAVISKIPPRSGLDVKVSLFRKQQLSDYEFDRDSLETFAGDLGDFDGQAHKDLCFALKIGGKAPFVAPIDMTLESNSTTAKAAKALLMMTLPFRLVPDQLGIKHADDGDGDSDNEGDDDDDEESSGQRCNVMYVMDSAAAATYVELKKDMKIIRASYEANGGDLRCIVVTSPPWGVLDDERTEPGHEDEPLTSDAIAALAIGLSELFGSKTVVCIHLPPLEQHAWRKKFEATGKWAAYNNPVVVVPTSTKSLTYFNKYQQANNVFSFLCFHRADVHPIVTSDFLREKPGMHKLCHALWNAGTTIPSAVVPKAERVAVRNAKEDDVHANPAIGYRRGETPDPHVWASHEGTGAGSHRGSLHGNRINSSRGTATRMRVHWLGPRSDHCTSCARKIPCAEQGPFTCFYDRIRDVQCDNKSFHTSYESYTPSGRGMCDNRTYDGALTCVQQSIGW